MIILNTFDSSFPISHLQDIRKLKIKKASHERVRNSRLEKIQYKYMQIFFNSFQVWSQVLGLDFIECVKNKICIRKRDSYLKGNSNSVLEGDDLELYRKFKIFFKDDIEFDSTSLLKEVKSVLEKKILRIWTEEFFKPLEELLKNFLNENSNLEWKFLKRDFKKNIIDFFDQNRNVWEKYLLSPQEGFYYYLNDLTGVVFSTY